MLAGGQVRTRRANAVRLMHRVQRRLRRRRTVIHSTENVAEIAKNASISRNPINGIRRHDICARFPAILNAPTDRAATFPTVIGQIAGYEMKVIRFLLLEIET